MIARSECDILQAYINYEKSMIDNSEAVLTKKEKKKLAKEESKRKQRRQARKKIIIWIVVVLLILIIGITIWLISSSSSRSGMAVSKNDPAIGPMDAPVLLRAYEDFACSACAAVSLAVDDLLEKYGDQVRYEFNDFPLPNHQWATTAAVGAQCAHEQDQFFAYHDLLYKNQDEWSLADEKEVFDTLRGYAEDLDLNMAAFQDCVSTAAAAELVNQDIDEGTKLDINSTPTFFVNDQRITEAPFSVHIREAIDQALSN